MKFKSRGERGEKLMKAAKIADTSTSMQKFPWSNPLKGSYKDVAMAEVSVKSAGLFVGFKVKF
jgi:hypothetical protein